jgi:hypothetical protein
MKSYIYYGLVVFDVTEHLKATELPLAALGRID